MKKLLLFICTLGTFFTTVAQEEERTRTPIGGRPDLKGDLFVEFGLNVLNNRPSELNTRLMRSRTFNAYYQLPINLFGEGSGFTFNPGLGLGVDKFNFTNRRNLFNNPEVGPNSSRLLDVTTVYGEDITVQSNNFTVTYFDVPLEFRYHFNTRNYNKSFKIALGAKVGYALKAQTKVRFSDENELTRQIKDRQSFGINPFRYGIYTRIGSGGFNVWAHYALNSLFEADLGPFGTEASQFNFGISVALF
ncbi:porin family protein [Mongoliitalea daihaiensis]|uniref:porin family protein n=1 Tax=Mongoliitalea daihaiensis TaxID=2782006 RepID=UPI001F16B1BE|nr:porin family protein [Mongoliitalea daihaiensis]UJP65146.1 PorT family protein [Mongoliitalea daihaiensis]